MAVGPSVADIRFFRRNCGHGRRVGGFQLHGDAVRQIGFRLVAFGVGHARFHIAAEALIYYRLAFVVVSRPFGYRCIVFVYQTVADFSSRDSGRVQRGNCDFGRAVEINPERGFILFDAFAEGNVGDFQFRVTEIVNFQNDGSPLAVVAGYGHEISAVFGNGKGFFGGDVFAVYGDTFKSRCADGRVDTHFVRHRGKRRHRLFEFHGGFHGVNHHAVAVGSGAFRSGAVDRFERVSRVGVFREDQLGAVEFIPTRTVVVVVGNAGKAFFFGGEIKSCTVRSPTTECTVKRHADDRFLLIDFDNHFGDFAFVGRIADGFHFITVCAGLGCHKGVAVERLPLAVIHAVLVFVNAGERGAFEFHRNIVRRPSVRFIVFALGRCGNGHRGGLFGINHIPFRGKRCGNVTRLIVSARFDPAFEVQVLKRLIACIINRPIGVSIGCGVKIAVFNTVNAGNTFVARGNGYFHLCVEEQAERAVNPSCEAAGDFLL